jgi:hypothetical protein
VLQKKLDSIKTDSSLQSASEYTKYSRGSPTSTERLNEEWTSSIYAFYAPYPVIGYEGKRCYHEFKCAAKGCKKRVRLDKMDAQVTCENMQGVAGETMLSSLRTKLGLVMLHVILLFGRCCVMELSQRHSSAKERGKLRICIDSTRRQRLGMLSNDLLLWWLPLNQSLYGLPITLILAVLWCWQKLFASSGGRVLCVKRLGCYLHPCVFSAFN